jgi:hypothetical protein
MVIKKIPGETNLGGIGTKNLEYDRHAYLMKAIGMYDMKEISNVQSVGSLDGSSIVGGTNGGMQHAAVLGALALLFQALGAKGDTADCFQQVSADGLRLAIFGRQEAWDQHWRFLSFDIALAIFTVGTLCGIWLTRKFYQCVGQTGTKTEAKATKKTAKNGKPAAITRSMTTYTWWTENPRRKLQSDDGAYHVC